MTIDDIQSHIDEFNETAAAEALQDFSRQIGTEMAFSCDRYAAFAKACAQAIKAHRAFEMFGAFDNDEIARIYSTDAVILYEGYDLDMSQRPVVTEDWRDYAIEQTFFATIEEAYNRDAFIVAFEKYLRAAAKLAKSITSTAQVPYREALELSNKTKSKYSRLSLSADEALRLVHLEKTAAQTLLDDLNKFNRG